ncbi:hypothetical protein [Massilia sp. CF038]|uniref:hypothetical protein n=1 Tax=Massilia sp. CF038 TaxID=1881045 RepID=UPI00090EDCF1|nr:hypothetical protein [Massilia sp. CF038]SHH45960.1 hypothetical protein SAMN05428948_4127 [Massilia sp. CF038]
MEPFIIALLAHGVIGGTDVVLNHELIARLPSQASARTEQVLHSGRELAFALLFTALAWGEWHGAAALLIGAILVGETLISTVDMVVEINTRILPVSERVLHVLLFTNYGIVLALVGQTLLDWWQLPTALVPADHGWASWVLSLMALASLGWCVRDALSVRRLQTTAAA